MRVGIDATSIVGDRGGVGVVTYHLLKELPRLDEALELVAYVAPGTLCRSTLEGWPSHSRLRWVEAGRWQMRGRGRQDGLDLFHGANFKMRTTGRCGGVVTIHDLWLERHPEYSTKFLGQRLSTWRTARTVRQARRVITISNCSAHDLQELYGLSSDHIRVVTLGVSSEFNVGVEADQVKALKSRLQIPDRPYVLFVGGADPRKNHRTLVRAFAQCRHDLHDHMIVLVGDAVHRFGSYHDSVRAERLEDSVHCPGRVSSEDLRLLYAGAAVFVFPSIYEGFGMPILEAMASGTPVVTSNTTSLPEVAGDAALLVNPKSPEDLGTALLRVLRDEPLRQTLRTKGLERVKQFTWERTARETLAVYREVCEQA